jgi:hypothetical protein
MEINNTVFSSTYNEQFYKVIVKCYTMWFVNTTIFTKYKNPSSIKYKNPSSIKYKNPSSIKYKNLSFIKYKNVTCQYHSCPQNIKILHLQKI